jgi:hypothetical protein
MSESRVRENRTHGSMRRREATPDQSAYALRSPDASRRPCGPAMRSRLLLLLLAEAEQQSARRRTGGLETAGRSEGFVEGPL